MHTELRHRVAALGAVTAIVLAACSSSEGSTAPTDPATGSTEPEVTETTEATATTVSPEPVDLGRLAGGADLACDPLDEAHCLLPFPSDVITRSDAATATGLRLDIEVDSMPTNASGVPVDPARVNTSDGFSPGQSILVRIPDLDLDATWGVSDLPPAQRPLLADLSRVEAPDAPVLLVNATTGERHPIFTEMDRHPLTTDDERLLLVRPARTLEPGQRYLVALRSLRAADGSVIRPEAPFAELLDKYLAGDPAAELDELRPGAHRVLSELVDLEPDFDPAPLYLAWDFTVASDASLTDPGRAMRDEAFALLGDTDLADGIVEGESPAFTVTLVRDITEEERASGTFNESNGRIIEGFLTVPNYLDRAARIDEGVVEGERIAAEPARLVLGEGDTATLQPVINPDLPTVDVGFTCTIPVDATAEAPATPMLYAHGALSSRRDTVTSRSGDQRRNGFLTCGVDLWGFSDLDVGTIAGVLGDLSAFPTIPDQTMQGVLNHLYLGRLMVHPDGLVADPAFADAAGQPVVTTEGLVYAGFSNGATVGTMITALAPDWTRAQLGVPGINYLVTLQRSLDWEGAVADLFYSSYPGGITSQLVLSLVQVAWDRAEGTGYVHRSTSDPLPGTPPHELYLLPALGDPNTSNISAEILARSVDAALRVPVTPDGTHWAVDPTWGFDTIGDDPGDYSGTDADAYLLYVTSSDRQVQLPPDLSNIPNPNSGEGSPHGDPQRDDVVQAHAAHWLRTGEFLEPCGGEACMSTEATRTGQG